MEVSSASDVLVAQARRLAVELNNSLDFLQKYDIECVSVVGNPLTAERYAPTPIGRVSLVLHFKTIKDT